jgi:FAD/FMN-containing dehydrogenase
VTESTTPDRPSAGAARFAFAEPGTDAYRAATATYNLDVHLEPPLAATVHGVEEAQAALAEARARGLGVRVLATGHYADACAPLGDEAVVRVAFDDPVDVDVDRRLATVYAGTRWGAVAQATTPHGLVAPHGSSPTVGAIGYLLGGGISYYGRRLGVASNSVLSMQLLTADGAVREVDAETDPELFDALRGGGGGFGIVVSATVALHPVSSVVTGAAFWPMAAAAPLLEAWCRWTRDAPWSASTSFRTLNFPPDPALPPALVGASLFCVDGAIIDEPDTPAAEVAAGLLDPLRGVAEPVLDTWHEGGPMDVTASHMDPLDPLPYEADHVLLADLDAEGQERLLSVAATERGDALAFVELRQTGGAMGEADPRGGVLSRLEAAYALYVLGVLTGTDVDARIPGQLAAVRDAVARWDTGFTAPTFAAGWDPRQRSFDRATAERMQRVRGRVDPEGIFAGNVVRGARVA